MSGARRRFAGQHWTKVQLMAHFGAAGLRATQSGSDFARTAGCAQHPTVPTREFDHEIDRRAADAQKGRGRCTSSDDDPVARRQITRTAALVTELRSSRTDLARIVQAAHRNNSPFLVVQAQSVRAWEQREPGSWARVCDWLAAHSIEIVEA
jgi:hypothetical protein